MSARVTTIDCTCGIFETWYTLRDYGSRIVVTAPYIRWQGNSGNLAYEKRTYRDAGALAALRDMANNESLSTSDDYCPVTIDDLCKIYPYAVRKA